MPKFDTYDELTDPADDDILGAIKDVSEPNPENQTKVEKHSTLYGYIRRKFVSTKIEGMQLIRNSGTSVSVGTGSLYTESGDFVDVVSVLTASSLSLSNNTEYHIYVYLSGETPSLEISTTAPVAWKGLAYSKTGNTSRRYVGSFLTDGSGNIRYFWHNPITNEIKYGQASLGAAPYRVASALTSAAAASIDCSAIVPPTVLTAKVRISTTANQNLFIGNSGLSTSAYFLLLPAAVDDAQIIIEDIPLASRVFYYMYGAAVGSGSLNGDIIGYQFAR